MPSAMMRLMLRGPAGLLWSVLVAGPMSCSLAAHTKPDRDSGQSTLMDGTFAGKNACNPDNHLRPFIIEWDATDSSSFEEFAASDLVVVRYEGCSLRVLDECRKEREHGLLGAYKPVEWTSGAIEVLEIENEAELYAKLPLGQATLGARVQGGEKFYMEYYVAGTAAATRDAVYRAELADLPGCQGATHFVSGYNLGAFALASRKNIEASAGGSVFGFGAGAAERRKSRADKHGGKLPVCDSDSAREIDGCQAPIRLTLREIRDGVNPDDAATKRPDTPESLAAAALLAAKMKMYEQAAASFEAANRKLAAGDGKGCLADLDAHDRHDAKHKSTDPRSGFSFMRAQCVMLSGNCSAGKSVMRKSFEQMASSADADPTAIDRMVEQYAARHCQGKMSDRDALLKAINTLSVGVHNTKIGIAGCTEALATVEKLRKTVKPKDAEDWDIVNLERNLPAFAAGCLGRNGDCKLAMKWLKKTMPKSDIANFDAEPDPTKRAQLYNGLLGDYSTKCKKV
jgi:hypothetical protein